MQIPVSIFYKHKKYPRILKNSKAKQMWFMLELLNICNNTTKEKNNWNIFEHTLYVKWVNIKHNTSLIIFLLVVKMALNYVELHSTLIIIKSFEQLFSEWPEDQLSSKIFTLICRSLWKSPFNPQHVSRYSLYASTQLTTSLRWVIKMFC